MPLRSSEFRELCVECQAHAEAECHRCSAPLCPDHTPAEDRRCDDCEAVYLDMIRVEGKVLQAHEQGRAYTTVRRHIALLPVLTLLTPLVWFLAGLPAAAVVTLAAWIGIRMLVPPSVPEATLRAKVKRQRFLGQRKRNRQLRTRKRRKLPPAPQSEKPASADGDEG